MRRVPAPTVGHLTAREPRLCNVRAMTAIAPPPDRTLELAIAALVRLVREDYPADRGLGYIGRTWGEATADEVAALEYVETWLAQQKPTP